MTILDTQPHTRFVTRFAPSPTGLLHKGHALSALTVFSAFKQARAAGQAAEFLLRIEDIDPTRCRPAFTEAIFEDLSWLGLKWAQSVRRQSQHMADYGAALHQLKSLGLVYPCFCTRKIITDTAKDQTAAASGRLIYPGTCKHLNAAEQNSRKQKNMPFAWRLDMAKAYAHIETASNPALLCWHDMHAGPQQTSPEQLLTQFGDIVIARKETPTSYHLSVVTDDALQGVTHVIRGMDLIEETAVHIVLQRLLGLPTPLYQHHSLLLDRDGSKLSKTKASTSLRELRESGITAPELRRELGFQA